MRRLSGVLAVFIMAAGAAPSTAWSSPLGNGNAGDVWVDNVGQPPGPGHEMDPHLACQNINLWGSGLADGSGTFTVDGWSPSGRKESDYGPTAWTYQPSKAGSQVIAVIDVHALITEAVQHGDTPLGTQGYHFKLQFSQDPQKHKTFWVRCSPLPSPPPGPSTPPPPPPSTPPPSPPSTPPPSPAGGSPQPALTSSPQPKLRHVSKPRKRQRSRRRPRHHSSPRRPARPPQRPVPAFTG